MGSITVPLTSCFTHLDYSVLQIKTKIVRSHTADSKPVEQEVNGTMILPPLVFPDECHGANYVYIFSSGRVVTGVEIPIGLAPGMIYFPGMDFGFLTISGSGKWRLVFSLNNWEIFFAWISLFCK
jgi:hypothetical protein